MGEVISYTKEGIDENLGNAIFGIGTDGNVLLLTKGDGSVIQVPIGLGSVVNGGIDGTDLLLTRGDGSVVTVALPVQSFQITEILQFSYNGSVPAEQSLPQEVDSGGDCDLVECRLEVAGTADTVVDILVNDVVVPAAQVTVLAGQLTASVDPVDVSFIEGDLVRVLPTPGTGSEGLIVRVRARRVV